MIHDSQWFHERRRHTVGAQLIVNKQIFWIAPTPNGMGQGCVDWKAQQLEVAIQFNELLLL